MVNYIGKTLDISVDVVILPGFNEGLSQRGAWFAQTPYSRSLFRKFRPGRQHVLRYLIHEPCSRTPLSDGEINHLVNEITSSLDDYRSTLKRLEMQFRDIRKRGKLNALIYILGILTVRWYWWIFLTRGEMSFNNSLNAGDLNRAEKAGNVVTRFWERAGNRASAEILTETVERYKGLDGAPLAKYRELREWALSNAAAEGENGERAEAWIRVASGYRAIIRKLTGRSLVTEMLPTSFIQRIVYFFQRSYRVPEPDYLYPVRNLSLQLNCPEENTEADYPGKSVPVTGRNTANGNIMELYALAGRSGAPVCIPTKHALQLSRALSRSTNIRDRDLNLEIVLHVGTEEEKAELLAFDRRKAQLVSRIRNASLDTTRMNEAMISYYIREQLPVMLRSFQVRYPFRSRLHSLFPWLFITNGIPIASVLAGVWLFVDPYYNAKFQNDYNKYFTRILEGIDWSYHGMILKVVTDPALAHINSMITGSIGSEASSRVYRDIAAEAGRYALPVSVLDRIILNNLTMETVQLADFCREANDFTTLPREDGDE